MQRSAKVTKRQQQLWRHPAVKQNDSLLDWGEIEERKREGKGESEQAKRRTLKTIRGGDA